MKKIFLLSVAATLALLACSASENKTYDKSGVSFTYPGDWSITDEDGDGEAWRSITVEKSGYSASGMLVITCIGKEPGDEPIGDILLESTMGSLDEGFNGLRFSDVTDTNYGSYPAKTVSYTTTFMGLAHSGRLYALDTDSMAICIMEQEADEDARKNKPGFELFESTFTLK